MNIIATVQVVRYMSFRILTFFCIFISVECIRHPPTYFAKRLHNALDRMNVDDDTLIRCLVGRSEVSINF
jgi:hypothetical protein